MSAKVNENGEITLPRELLEAASIHAGDAVTFRARPDGGIIIEKASDEAYRLMLEDMGRRKPFKGFTTKELIALTRGVRLNYIGYPRRDVEGGAVRLGRSDVRSRRRPAAQIEGARE